MSSQAPNGYPSPYQRPGSSLNRPLQPEQVSGYSSLAQWHGGQLPLYPPQGQPAPHPEPPAHQPQPHRPPSVSVSVPSPTSSGDHLLPGPSSGLASQSLNHPRNGSDDSAIRKIGPFDFVPYSPGWSTKQSEPSAVSTCVCGVSFNAPRERERHWVRVPSSAMFESIIFALKLDHTLHSKPSSVAVPLHLQETRLSFPLGTTARARRR